MATSSFGFTNDYVNQLLYETAEGRNFTTYLLPGETFKNANLGSGPLFGAGSIPTNNIVTVVCGSVQTTQFVYRGRIGATYVYSIGSPPGGGAVDIVIVGQV